MMNQLRFQNYGSIPFGKEADLSNEGGYLWPLTEVDNKGLTESSGCARRMTGATVPAVDEINITYLTATCVLSPGGDLDKAVSLSKISKFCFLPQNISVWISLGTLSFYSSFSFCLHLGRDTNFPLWNVIAVQFSSFWAIKMAASPVKNNLMEPKATQTSCVFVG